MKEIISERRMYAGYPLFVITYFDKDKNRYNYSTFSSMYVLGKMVMIGLGDNNTKKCILEAKSFSVSFVNSEYLKDLEIGGMSGAEVDKFSESTFTLECKNDLCYIKQAELVYDLTFVEKFKSSEFPEFDNLVCRLNKVLGNDSIIENDSIDVDKFSPVMFMGTDQGTFYKKLSKI